jgi:hypothetical protein
MDVRRTEMVVRFIVLAIEAVAILHGSEMAPNHRLAWLGLAWLGLAWLGLAWLGLACEVVCYTISTRRRAD